MTRTFRAPASLVVLIAAATALQACRTLYERPSTIGDRGRDEWLTKAVRAKRPPNELIAEDLSVCRVTPDLYAGIRPGDLWRCAWQYVPEER